MRQVLPAKPQLGKSFQRRFYLVDSEDDFTLSTKTIYKFVIDLTKLVRFHDRHGE
jgi:hypothetical protein